MDKWVTLLTFKHPAQAHLLRTKLESEGIQAFVKNEYTAQIAPYHSEPATPVKLRILEKDVEAAVRILKESGHIGEEKTKPTPSALIRSIDVITSKIPGFRSKPLRLRVILAVAVVLVVLVLIFSMLTLPASL